MTALSITAASVIPAADAVKVKRTAGATLTAGLALYSDSADSFSQKAASNAAAATAIVTGIALQGVSDGQELDVQSDGTIAGMGTTEGVVYVLGTAGGIVPLADLVTGNRVTLIGVGNASGGLILSIKSTGMQVQ